MIFKTRSALKILRMLAKDRQALIATVRLEYLISCTEPLEQSNSAGRASGQMRFLASRGSPCTVCSERNRREPVLGSKTLLHQNAGSTRQPTLRGPEPSPFLVRRTSRPFAPPSSPFLDDFTKKRRKKKEKKRPTRVRIAGGLGDRGRLTGYAAQAVDPLLLIALIRAQ